MVALVPLDFYSMMSQVSPYSNASSDTELGRENERKRERKREGERG